LRYRAQPIIPIVGARKLAQLQDNLASLELSLSPEQVRLLDDATRIEMGVPHDFFARERVQELAYGGLRDRIVG
jgi:diketogulonate reductase-like aldo/keto reductase